MQNACKASIAKLQAKMQDKDKKTHQSRLSWDRKTIAMVRSKAVHKRKSEQSQANELVLHLCPEALQHACQMFLALSSRWDLVCLPAIIVIAVRVPRQSEQALQLLMQDADIIKWKAKALKLDKKLKSIRLQQDRTLSVAELRSIAEIIPVPEKARSFVSTLCLPFIKVGRARASLNAKSEIVLRSRSTSMNVTCGPCHDSRAGNSMACQYATASMMGPF